MKLFNKTNPGLFAGLAASLVLSFGVLSGCEYCQPLLLATIFIPAINAVFRWLKTTMPNDWIELFSHLAH